MKGGDSQVPHTFSEKWFFLKPFRIIPWLKFPFWFSAHLPKQYTYVFSDVLCHAFANAWKILNYNHQKDKKMINDFHGK